MSEKNKKEISIEKEIEKARIQTKAEILRSRAIDYIAILLGLGAVFLLWLFQWMGLYWKIPP